jgi:hypothetical protein
MRMNHLTRQRYRLPLYRIPIIKQVSGGYVSASPHRCCFCSRLCGILTTPRMHHHQQRGWYSAARRIASGVWVGFSWSHPTNKALLCSLLLTGEPTLVRENEQRKHYVHDHDLYAHWYLQCEGDAFIKGYATKNCSGYPLL